MDDSYEIKTTARHLNVGLASQLFELFGFLLSDAAVDVEVVGREPGLSNEMHERLRRSLDRIDCAQNVFEAMREGRCLGRARQGASTEKCEGRTAKRDGDGDGDGDGDQSYVLAMKAGARGALELPAGDWPQDYLEGAFEWLLLES